VLLIRNPRSPLSARLRGHLSVKPSRFSFGNYRISLHDFRDVQVITRRQAPQLLRLRLFFWSIAFDFRRLLSKFRFIQRGEFSLFFWMANKALRFRSFMLRTPISLGFKIRNEF
jgi:hypothetical protein